MELDRDLIFLEKLERGRIENVLEELEDQFENEVLGVFQIDEVFVKFLG